MLTHGWRFFTELARNERGAVTLEYLLVAMTIGLTTALAIVSTLPAAQRQQTKQVTTLYGPYP